MRTAELVGTPMENNEITERVRDLLREVSTLRAEYSAGMESIYKIATTLHAGEYYNALGPVLSSMPIVSFNMKLGELAGRIHLLVSDLDTVTPKASDTKEEG